MLAKDVIKDLGRWFSWYPLRSIVQKLPLKASYLIADIIGLISFKLMSDRREAMRDELLSIFGDNLSTVNANKIISECFSLIVKERIDILMFPKMNSHSVGKVSRIDGVKKIDEALKNNKGVILLTAHFGNQRYIMPALGYREYKMNQIGAPPTVWKELEQKISKMTAKTLDLELEHEKSLPAKFIYYDKFMRDAYECLKRNEILIIAGDSVGGGKKHETDFLNRTAMLSTGPFKIALTSGATLFPCFVLREKDNTQTVKIEDKIELPADNEKNYETTALREFMKTLEIYVKNYPSHYLKHLWWVQKRRFDDPVPFFKEEV